MLYHDNKTVLKLYRIKIMEVKPIQRALRSKLQKLLGVTVLSRFSSLSGSTFVDDSRYLKDISITISV